MTRWPPSLAAMPSPPEWKISSGKLLWFLASDITYKDFNSSDGYLTGSEVRFPQS